jgi:CBS domain-containing protein
VICVVCGFDNIEGQDNCENCGADLRTVDIPAAATPFEDRMQRPVAALRPHPAPTTTPDASVAEVVETMRNRHEDCVLVTDDERVVGIFTERDAVLKLAGRSLDGVTIGEAMTRDPVVLHAEDPVAAAIRTMAVGGFRHVPLVDDAGRGTGLVSAVDVFRYALTTS